MPTPFESAQLNLQLFDLRREPVLRKARDWFIQECNPESFEELVALSSGEHNTDFRMVLSYWDMAASLVTNHAIDAEAFLAANGEIVAAYSKIEPFIVQIRETVNEPAFCRHLEAVVMSMPDAAAILKRRREAILAMVKSRQAAGEGLLT